MRVDLHVHSTHSLDSRFSLEEIHSLVNQYEIPVATITDHESVDGCLEFMERWPEVPFLPGIEMTCEEGDFLIHTLDTDLLRFLQKKGLRSILTFKRDDNISVIWAHPLTRKFGEEDGFFSLEENLKKVMEHIDGIEILNGNVMVRIAIGEEPKTYPDRMRAIADRFGKAQTGSSDSHNFYNFLNCWSDIPPEFATPEGVIRAIKQAKTTPRVEASYFERIAKVVDRVR